LNESALWSKECLERTSCCKLSRGVVFSAFTLKRVRTILRISGQGHRRWCRGRGRGRVTREGGVSRDLVGEGVQGEGLGICEHDGSSSEGTEATVRNACVDEELGAHMLEDEASRLEGALHQLQSRQDDASLALARERLGEERGRGVGSSSREGTAPSTSVPPVWPP
jgi:hypothetical protein